jgi:cytochrome P450
MYPVANSVINRRCIEETEIKGIRIPKGLLISVDVLSLHYNPEYWGQVDPNEFYPLRFKDSNINKQAYLPFGNCLIFRVNINIIRIKLKS